MSGPEQKEAGASGVRRAAGAKDPRPEVGRAGEDLACASLIGSGYEILERNHRSRYGELDIIARRGRVVVFVEVKSRLGRGFGEPFEAVDGRKQRQIKRMAQAWLAAHQAGGGLSDCDFRFDVFSIILDRAGGRPRIEHLPDAFR